MKYHLRSLVFVTTIVALSVGWFLDRMNCEQKTAQRKQEINEVNAGATFVARATTTLALAAQLSKSRKTVDELLYERLAGNVWSLWKNESIVNTSLKLDSNGFTANQLTGRILDSMKCQSVQEYFSEAKSIKGFSNYPQHFPEVFDSKSAEFDSFTLFVDNAINK